MDKRRFGPSCGILSKVYVDDTARASLCECCRRGDLVGVRKMMRHEPVFDINYKDEYGYSLLHIASRGGHSDIVQLLIENGSDVNIKTTAAVTPLHLAVRGNQVDVVKLLVLADAKLDIHDANKLTPIDHASYPTETWTILTAAQRGVKTDIEKLSEKVTIPAHIIPCALIEEEYRKKKEEEMKEKKAKAKKQQGK